MFLELDIPRKILFTKGVLGARGVIIGIPLLCHE